MRTYSVELFNRIINDPSIRTTFGGEGYLDCAALILDTNNYALANEEGGFIFIMKHPHLFEVHTVFPRSASPLKTVRFMKQCAVYMFTQTACETIVTQVPDDNKGASKLCDIMGFQEDLHDADAWKPGIGISHRSLSLDRWRRVWCTTQEAGKAFPLVRDPANLAVKGTSICRSD